MTCPDYNIFIGNGSKEHIEILETNALADITAVLGIEPVYGISQDLLFGLKNRHFNSNGPFYNIQNNRAIPFFFEGSGRFYNINHQSWIYRPNRGFFGPINTRGRYNYRTGTIMLHDPVWCRHTIIHEILHATSVFSRIPIETYSSFEIQQPLREGMTDTLTGYVMSKLYPDCYTSWKSNTYQQCGVFGYGPNVSLWGALCQFTGIKPLTEFYLSQENNLSGPWENYCKYIEELDFNALDYNLDRRTVYNEEELKQKAFEAINGLEDLYTDYYESMEFNKIED